MTILSIRTWKFLVLMNWVWVVVDYPKERTEWTSSYNKVLVEENVLKGVGSGFINDVDTKFYLLVFSIQFHCVQHSQWIFVTLFHEF